MKCGAEPLWTRVDGPVIAVTVLVIIGGDALMQHRVINRGNSSAHVAHKDQQIIKFPFVFRPS